MNALIAVASTHGGTLGIGEVFGDEARQGGIGAAVRDVADVSDLEGYDAVVLGSAVYVGHWLAAAQRFMDANVVAPGSMPAWVFRGGPLGDPRYRPTTFGTSRCSRAGKRAGTLHLRRPTRPGQSGAARASPRRGGPPAIGRLP